MKLINGNSQAQSIYLPAKLDRQLRAEIFDYLEVDEHSFSTLARDIDQYVRHQYRDAWELIEDGCLKEEQLHEHIAAHCPKVEYLMDYAKGGAMCFRYTNSVANFFGIRYRLSSFNPADDLGEAILSRVSV